MSWEIFLQQFTSSAILITVITTALVLAGQLWPTWQMQTKPVRFGVIVAVCFGLPCLAALLGVLTLGWPADFITTYWPALRSGGIACAACLSAEGFQITGRLADRSVATRSMVRSRDLTRNP